MIPPYVRNHRAPLAVLCVLTAFLIEVSCDKAALTAPTNSTITLFSNTTIVALGGTAEITATVTAAGNRTTTIEAVEPPEARSSDDTGSGPHPPRHRLSAGGEADGADAITSGD